MMSSLFIGASGLRAHGDGMQTVGSNLANVNTVGFKRQMMLYSDHTSKTLPTQSNSITNMSQSGMGVYAGAVRTIFSQGGFESGSASTDLAIAGNGFFGVTKNGTTHYTRAGNFRFTKAGELLDPSGWNALGRKITNGTVASQTSPVQLDFSTTGAGVGYMPAQSSTWVKTISLLGSITETQTTATTPHFALASTWDGTKSTPLGKGEYSHSEGIAFYDNSGKLQNATVYYDLADSKNGFKVVEYVIAMNPELDASGRAGTASAGLLLAGTVSFSSDGNPQSLTAFTPPSTGPTNDLTQWTAAPLQNGYPVFSPNVTGAGAQSIKFDIGLQVQSSALGFATAQDAAADPAAFLGIDKTLVRGSSTIKMYGGTSGNTQFLTDGFPEGYLRDVQVRQNGTVTGVYSNSQSKDLYQLSLYTFTSQDGLRQEGNNHFSAGADAGEVLEGVAGSGHYGNILERNLEQSNVDYAREFTTMIITQRGFQVNSKVVTTSDQMLQKALEIKR